MTDLDTATNSAADNNKFEASHQSSFSSSYESTDAIKGRLEYGPLPPGEITPTGWLMDWANTARDGITGHLDERAITFNKGWTGESFESRGVGEQGTGWPLEQCAYWLDGLVRLGYAMQDEYLINKSRSRLDPIVQGVFNGEDSLIYWRPKEQLENNFDNWAHSH